MTTHISTRQRNNEYLISPVSDSPEDELPELFDVERLAHQGKISGQANGRGQVYFLRTQSGDQVLRHYRRGGLPRHISADQFIWTGLTRSRPWREMTLTTKLRALGFNVPVPLAARAQRSGFTYTADILTERIDGARSLAEIALSDPAGAIWGEIGRVIRCFHDVSAHHADLNIRNILIDGDERVWLIDWDRGHLRATARAKARSLKRLKRSLAREPALGSAIDHGWKRLLDAYETAS